MCACRIYPSRCYAYVYSTQLLLLLLLLVLLAVLFCGRTYDLLIAMHAAFHASSRHAYLRPRVVRISWSALHSGGKTSCLGSSHVCISGNQTTGRLPRRRKPSSSRRRTGVCTQSTASQIDCCQVSPARAHYPGLCSTVMYVSMHDATRNRSAYAILVHSINQIW